MSTKNTRFLKIISIFPLDEEIMLAFLKKYDELFTKEKAESMYKKLLVLLLIFVFNTFAFSGAVLSDFRAEAGLNRVELKWVVSAETGIKGYRVLRSLDGVQFQKIGFVAATGVAGREQTYRFTDSSVFKLSGRLFYYKLEFVNEDDSANEYEKMVTITPQISSTRHTWGSLKAMFR
jgi:hypothetical protein